MRETNIVTDRETKLMSNLAAFYIKYGDAEEAIAILDLLLSLNPQDADALRLMVRAQLSNGSAEIANTYFSMLKQLVPFSQMPLHIAMLELIIYMRMKRFGDVPELLQQFFARG